MPLTLQMALAIRDRRALGLPPDSELLLAVRDAIDAELEPPATTTEPGESQVYHNHGTRPAGPAPSWWQRVADQAGEPVLILGREQTVVSGLRDCLPYAVVESAASGWERANFTERVEPAEVPG